MLQQESPRTSAARLAPNQPPTNARPDRPKYDLVINVLASHQSLHVCKGEWPVSEEKMNEKKRDMADGVRSFFTWATTTGSMKEASTLVQDTRSIIENTRQLDISTIDRLLGKYKTTTHHSFAQDSILRRLASFTFNFPQCQFESIVYHAQCAVGFIRGFQVGDCPTSDAMATPFNATISALDKRNIIGPCIELSAENLPLIKGKLEQITTEHEKPHILIIITVEHVADCPSVSHHGMEMIEDSESSENPIPPCGLPPCGLPPCSTNPASLQTLNQPSNSPQSHCTL